MIQFTRASVWFPNDSWNENLRSKLKDPAEDLIITVFGQLELEVPEIRRLCPESECKYTKHQSYK